MRSLALWGNLMGGGAGIEWYFDFADATLEDFRVAEPLWGDTRHALEFFRDHVYVDEEGQYSGALHKYGPFVITKGDQQRPFIGYGLVLGDKGNGEDASPRMSLEALRAMVTFPTLAELRRAAAAGIYDR